MLEAVKLMAAVCLVNTINFSVGHSLEEVSEICVKFLSDRLPQVPPDGHEKTLEAITIAGEVKGRDRFQPIVQVESQTSSVKKYKLIV